MITWQFKTISGEKKKKTKKIGDGCWVLCEATDLLKKNEKGKHQATKKNCHKRRLCMWDPRDWKYMLWQERKKKKRGSRIMDAATRRKKSLGKFESTGS